MKKGGEDDDTFVAQLLRGRLDTMGVELTPSYALPLPTFLNLEEDEEEERDADARGTNGAPELTAEAKLLRLVVEGLAAVLVRCSAADAGADECDELLHALGSLAAVAPLCSCVDRCAEGAVFTTAAGRSASRSFRLESVDAAGLSPAHATGERVEDVSGAFAIALQRSLSRSCSFVSLAREQALARSHTQALAHIPCPPVLPSPTSGEGAFLPVLLSLAVSAMSADASSVTLSSDALSAAALAFMRAVVGTIARVVARAADASAHPLTELLESAALAVMEQVRCAVEAGTTAGRRSLWACAVELLSTLLQLDFGANAAAGACAERLSVHQRAAELVRYALSGGHGAEAVRTAGALVAACSAAPRRSADADSDAESKSAALDAVSDAERRVGARSVFISFVCFSSFLFALSCLLIHFCCPTHQSKSDAASVYLRIVGPPVLAAAVRTPEASEGIQAEAVKFLLLAVMTAPAGARQDALIAPILQVVLVILNTPTAPRDLKALVAQAALQVRRFCCRRRLMCFGGLIVVALFAPPRSQPSTLRL